RLHEGNANAAVAAAQRLVDRAEAAGNSYPEASYDRALADLVLGRALRLAGRPPEALSPLERAERRFEEVRGAGEEEAARMLGAVAGESGDALVNLGRLEEAAASQERGIAIHEQWGSRRNAAVGRGQLGTVRLLQGRLQEALEAYEQ